MTTEAIPTNGAGCIKIAQLGGTVLAQVIGPSAGSHDIRPEEERCGGTRLGARARPLKCGPGR